MSVLLIHPRQVGDVGLQDMALVEPLAIERLAGAIPEAGPQVLDMRLDPDLEGALEALRPAVVGIACPFTTQVPEVLRTAERVRAAAPEAFVVVGGHHPTLRPQDFASPTIDAIVLGEGEATLRDLVACRAAGGALEEVSGLVLNTGAGQQRTAPREPVADLDALPLPARRLTAPWRRRYYWMNQRPHALVETSRGCPYRCTFCSVWRFHGTAVRYESPERIVEEVAAVGEPYILFTDDNFLLNVPRARRAAELLKARGLRKQYTFQARTDTITRHPDLLEQWRDIGLVCVFLGLEKASSEDLADLDKRNTLENNEAAIVLLKEMGIGFTGNFIADPQWDHAEFGELRDYVTRHQLFNSSFSVLTPLPGTVLHEEVESQIVERDYELFDLWHSVLPTRLPREEFYREFAGLWQAAAASTPQANRRRRLLKGLLQVLTGQVNLGHAKRLGRALARLRDPEVYLRAHRPG